MKSLWRTVWIGWLIAASALPVLAQTPLPGSTKEYTFTGRLSATNLTNVVGPGSVPVVVRLLWNGRVIAATPQFNLRPVDTTGDTWAGSFELTAAVPEGAYVRLVAGSRIAYPNGTGLVLRGTGLVYTGVNDTINFGIVPLTTPFR